MTSQTKSIATPDAHTSGSPHTKRSPGEQRALLFVAGTGIVLFLFATPIYGWRFSSGIALGAAVASVNLWATARTVRAFLTGQGATGEEPTLSVSWGVFALLKFSLLLLGVYLVFRFNLAHAFAFIVGLAALPLGMVALQLAGPKAPVQAAKVSGLGVRRARQPESKTT